MMEGLNRNSYAYWEKTKDIVDQVIDIILNYRQSGHPGGSRSKVHALLTLMLGGTMKWDIRNPHKRYADRFILGAGHTVPLVYATLAVLNEALRLKYQETGDDKYSPHKPEWALSWEDLLGFRRRGGLSGHAEMAGKTLFFKANTGPSGHGFGFAAGAALALKRAGAGEVKVFVLEGEGGLTPGETFEVANSAWGMALDNLNVLVDWNDFGIDSHPTSSNVYGNPQQWLASHGWQTYRVDNGEQWEELDETFSQMADEPNTDRVPRMVMFKTRKGRGYGKYDNSSHGAPHTMDSREFWATKEEFVSKYQVDFVNKGGQAPSDSAGIREEFRANLKVVMDVLAADTQLVDYLAGRLIEIGDSVPETIDTAVVGTNARTPYSDKRLYDAASYPAELYVPPGEKAANRAALAAWGAWVNA
ncbi:MAG: transketolase, partial [Spirochaetota bacterium]